MAAYQATTVYLLLQAQDLDTAELNNVKSLLLTMAASCSTALLTA